MSKGVLRGLSVAGMAIGASRPIIRGMDASRVRVLEDGTSSSDASDIGPDHGVPIDPLSARSIEVVRGAATLRYGSQAIGGVIRQRQRRSRNGMAIKIVARLPRRAYTIVERRQCSQRVVTR